MTHKNSSLIARRSLFNSMEQQKAQLRYLRIAPRKVRSVADLIRGLSVNEAQAQLAHVTRRPAQPLLKLLRSAVANAKNKKLDPDHLFIAEIRVDQGPMLKRILPRARGSASPIQKKMSHVLLVLGVDEKLSSKFTIPEKKKKKKDDGKGSKAAAKKKQDHEQRDIEGKPDKPEPKKQRGFFRRTFSGSSGSGK
jgi:large subunit ribosomal protein L22